MGLRALSAMYQVTLTENSAVKGLTSRIISFNRLFNVSATNDSGLSSHILKALEGDTALGKVIPTNRLGTLEKQGT